MTTVPTSVLWTTVGGQLRADRSASQSGTKVGKEMIRWIVLGRSLEAHKHQLRGVNLEAKRLT